MMFDTHTVVSVAALVVQLVALRYTERFANVVTARVRALIKAHDDHRKHEEVKQQLLKAVEYFAELSRKGEAA